jgi:hypothetical protein
LTKYAGPITWPSSEVGCFFGLVSLTYANTSLTTTTTPTMAISGSLFEDNVAPCTNVWGVVTARNRTTMPAGHAVRLGGSAQQPVLGC